MQTTPPTLGRWISNNGGASCTVEEVTIIEPEDGETADGFFIVSIQEDGDILDGHELTSDEWNIYLKANALTFTEKR